MTAAKGWGESLLLCFYLLPLFFISPNPTPFLICVPPLSPFPGGGPTHPLTSTLNWEGRKIGAGEGRRKTWLTSICVVQINLEPDDFGEVQDNGLAMTVKQETGWAPPWPGVVGGQGKIGVYRTWL